MEYRKLEKTGDQLSLLGYGCMRFPRKNGQIDVKKAEQQVYEAIEKGVNYFDTAYNYPGSEETLGKILKKEDRKKVKIATKIALPSVKSREDIDKLFEKQLKRLQTDYVDYFLIHNLGSIGEWEEYKQLGILNFIKQEQKNGRIINFGFSFHGNIVNFKKIVDDYNWDCAMIQYNYLDDKYQAGKEGLDYAASKGLGIIIMEPLKGGLLVDKLPNEAKEIINNYEVKKSPGAWGLSFVGDNPNVNVILSGMNDEKIIEENLNLFKEFKANSLTDNDKNMLNSVKEEINKAMAVSCTNCGYCIPCPQKIDIPMCFSFYNDKVMFGTINSRAMYLFNTFKNASASACTKCGTCEKKCPQNIPIMEELENVDKQMDNFFLRIIGKLVMKIMYR